MRKKLIIAGIVLGSVCVLGIICWKIVRFKKGERFSALSGLELSMEVTPTMTPSGTAWGEGSGLSDWEVRSSPGPAPTEAVKIGDVLLTGNELLNELFGKEDKSLLYGDGVSDCMQVIDDTVGIEMEQGHVLAAEFFAKDEKGDWLHLLYEQDTGKVRVNNCEKERTEFIEGQTRTELCLTWVDLENTEAYDSVLFLNAQESLLLYLQEVLFNGTYYDTYKSLDHEAAKDLLLEEADYAQFVWYVDNLRLNIQKRVSEQLVVNYLGCDKRDGYCYAGVQFGNFNPETGDYREVIEVWCVLFLSEEQEVRGFWMFGPGVLDQLNDDMTEKR